MPFIRPGAFGGSEAFKRKSGNGVVFNENDYASLLLHFDNVSSPAVFTDFSSNSYPAPTVYGNSQIVATQSVFGGASLYLDGTGDFADYAADMKFSLGSSDFTIDLRWRPDSATLDSQILGVNNGTVATGADISWGIRHLGATSSSKVQFYAYSGTTLIANIVSSVALAANTWYAIRVTRKGTRFTLNVDGTVEGTATPVWTSLNYASTMALRFGTYAASPAYFGKGYIDEVRILKGYAASDGAYTPAASPF